MNLQVNGKSVTAEENILLLEFLESNNFKVDQLVCAVNDNFIDKSIFGTTILKNNDNIEIMTFVGGG